MTYQLQAWDAGRGRQHGADHPNQLIRAMRMNPWRVRVEWYRLDPGYVGVKTGETREFIHHTGRAALRRLGSLIRGNLAPTLAKIGQGYVIGAWSPGGTVYTYTELQERLRDPDAMRFLGLID